MTTVEKMTAQFCKREDVRRMIEAAPENLRPLLTSCVKAGFCGGVAAGARLLEQRVFGDVRPPEATVQ